MMNDMSLKRIVFAGGGTPLVKLIKMVYETPNYKGVEVAAAFVPETEIDFFRHSFTNQSSLPIETVSHIERGRFNRHHALHNCDYLVSFNNMFLIDDKVVELFRYGGINYHAGSLPEYAGSYTYQWAIRNNETSFASTVHWIEGQADAGPIICKRVFPILPYETGLSLLMKCTDAAIEMMKEVFHDIDSDKPLPKVPQDLSRRGFYSIRDIMNSGRIDWNSKADEIGRLVRAADFFPFPSPTYEPYTETRTGIMKVLKTSLGRDQLYGSPGTVIYIDNNGIEVTAGSMKSLILTSIVIDGQKFRSPNVLKSGIKVGDCLG